MSTSEMTKNMFIYSPQTPANAIIEISDYHHSILLVLTLDELHLADSTMQLKLGAGLCISCN